MNKFKDFLIESSLSRLWDASRKHDYGTITAFRDRADCNTGKVFTKSDKLKRNASLVSKLLSKGYSVTKIKGSYIENYGSDDAREVGENSFFVVDIHDTKNLKKDLMLLGEYFEQDSIIFGLAGKQGDLIGTSRCEKAYPGYHVIATQGGAIFGKGGEFMSRVKGRPFVFSESLEIGDVDEYGSRRHPTELRGPVLSAKKEWFDLTEEETNRYQ